MTARPTLSTPADAPRPALRARLLDDRKAHAATLERHVVRPLTPSVGPTDAAGAPLRPKESA